MASASTRDRLGRRLFNVDEYHRLAEVGILRPDERLELLEGVIYLKYGGPDDHRRFHVDEYYRMAEAGILQPDERVELIDGEIYAMCPIGDRHAGCVNCLTAEFSQQLGRRVVVSVQNPIRLTDLTEPEPDLAILRPKPDFYRSGHPGPDDVLLVIEVMDSSAPRDRGLKLDAYARSNIREVWLVDLGRELIEVHRRPVGGVFTNHQTRPRGETVTCEAFPDVELAVDDILG